MALFDSGSSVGAMLAPALMIFLVTQAGGWRPAFVIVSTLGFFWLFLWRRTYHPPETHPRITPAERALDHEARLVISRELGHERETVTSVYLGR